MRRADKPIVIEQTYKTSLSKLWSALTRREEMILWFFDNIEYFRPEIGFKTQFAVQSEDRIFTHQWKITEIVPDQKITYTWKYAEYPGDSQVTIEIFEESDQVRLRLTMEVLADFPGDIPEFTRESCIGGWNYFIGENLKAYLEEERMNNK